MGTNKIYLKLVSHALILPNPIYLIYNSKRGKRTISCERIYVSVRTRKSKEPIMIGNKRGKVFKYSSLSDASKNAVNDAIEHWHSIF